MAGRSYLRVATAIPCAPTYRRRTNYVQQHPGSARSKTVKQPSIRKHHLSDFSTCEAILWHYDANFTTSRVTPRYLCWILQVWVLPVLPCIGRKQWGDLKEGTPFFNLQKTVLPRASSSVSSILQAYKQVVGCWRILRLAWRRINQPLIKHKKQHKIIIAPEIPTLRLFHRLHLPNMT